MRQPHPLWLMLDGLAIHNSRLELFNNAAVDGVTLWKLQSVQDQSSIWQEGSRLKRTYEIFHCAPCGTKHDG